MKLMTHKMLVIAGAAMLAACSATINPRIPSATTGTTFGDRLAAQRTASGMPNPIGHGTFTVFAIKISSVDVTNGDAAELVMNAFKRTLEGYGYRLVDPASAPESPIFECRIRQFEFKNYTWFAPVIFNWGDIALDLQLTDPSGKALWKQSYTGESWKFAYSFTRVVNDALEQILDKAVADFASPAFREACCERPAS